MNTYFIYLLVLASLRSEANSQIVVGETSCSSVTVSSLLQHGVKVHSKDAILLSKANRANNLNICQSGNWTCCSRQLEDKLYHASSATLQAEFQSKINATAHFFETQASLFEDYFKNLLKRSTVEWNSVLSSIYKEKYNDNRQIFLTLFNSLQDYYSYGNVSLGNTTDSFFKELLTRILWITRPTLNGKTDFFACVAKNMNNVKPFGNFQKSFSSEVIAALHIARSFTEALKLASNVSRSLSQEMLSQKCFRSFTRINKCSLCQNIARISVCKETCESVMKSCFHRSWDIDQKWNGYLRHLYSISKAMEGKNSLDNVAGQLAFQISGAIMDLQNNLTAVFKKVSSLCKVTGRIRRSVSVTTSDFYLEEDKSRTKRSGYNLPLDYGSTGARNSQTTTLKLSSLKSDFETKLYRHTKNVWINLRDQFCEDGKFATNDKTATCWNGKYIQKNSMPVPQLMERADNKQDNSTARINLHINRMELFTAESNKLLDGLLLRYRSSKIDSISESGSGSGSSGYSGDYSGDYSGVGSGASGDTTTDTTLVVTDDDTPQPRTGSGDFSTVITPTTDDDEDDEKSTESGSGSGDNRIPKIYTDEIATDTSDNDLSNNVNFDEVNRPATDALKPSGVMATHYISNKLLVLYFLLFLFIHT